MRSGERRLVTETPEMHRSPPMQSYISKEVHRPSKQWIHDVLLHRREAERVKLRTPDFVLLPDVDCTGKRPKSAEPDSPLCADPPADAQEATTDEERPGESWQKGIKPDPRRQWRMKRLPAQQCFHWLAVATDTNLRTLRDLRGHHAQMLHSLYTQTCQRIHEETGVDPGQIMAYVHYPPSVYQLHVHFKHLTGQGVSHDTLRVHPLPVILNNLRIDPDYYAKSRMQVPVYVHTELYAALAGLSHERSCVPTTFQITQTNFQTAIQTNFQTPEIQKTEPAGPKEDQDSKNPNPNQNPNQNPNPNQ
jgi:hypothetical protein